MSEMVDRVARAIWDAECEPVENDDTADWQRMVARAAIAAMREPTDAMVGAAVDKDDHGSSIFGEPYVSCPHEDAWRAMIDEALK